MQPMCMGHRSKRGSGKEALSVGNAGLPIADVGTLAHVRTG
jgi:hypothetical protein